MAMALAVRTGQWAPDLMRRPYVHLLWCFVALLEHDRIEAIVRRHERFDLASLVRLGVLDAKALSQEEQRFRAEPPPAEDEAEERGAEAALVRAARDAAERVRAYDALRGDDRWAPRPTEH